MKTKSSTIVETYFGDREFHKRLFSTITEQDFNQNVVEESLQHFPSRIFRDRVYGRDMFPQLLDREGHNIFCLIICNYNINDRK